MTSAAISRAIGQARDNEEQPSLIVVRTVLGLRRARQGGLVRGTRQSARRRRSPEDEAEPRLARAAAVLRSR